MRENSGVGFLNMSSIDAAEAKLHAIESFLHDLLSNNYRPQIPQRMLMNMLAEILMSRNKSSALPPHSNCDIGAFYKLWFVLDGWQGCETQCERDT